MIKYITCISTGTNINPKEIERETEKSVWINGRRDLKFTTFAQYHDTGQAALEYLIKAETEKRDRLKQNIVTYQTALVKTEAILQELKNR